MEMTKEGVPRQIGLRDTSNALPVPVPARHFAGSAGAFRDGRIWMGRRVWSVAMLTLFGVSAYALSPDEGLEKASRHDERGPGVSVGAPRRPSVPRPVGPAQPSKIVLETPQVVDTSPEELLRLAELVSAVVAKYATYPEELERRGLEGKVVLNIRISRDATLLGVKVEASSGHPELDAAAIDGVRRVPRFPEVPHWTPRQGLKVLVPIHYRLE